MPRTLPKYCLPLLLAALLASCESQTTTVGTIDSSVNKTTKGTVEESNGSEPKKTEPDNASEPRSETGKDTPPYIAPALEPGTYCYESSNETQDIQVRLTLDAADRVMGNVQGNIRNEQTAYYSGYRQSINGTIDGSNLNVDVATWIEYDQQNEQASWQVSPTELVLGEDTLSEADCNEVSKAFQNEKGLEPKDLTAGANNIKASEVIFPAGENSVSVSGVVVQGDRDVYTLSARGGQQIDLSITSAEDNAVVDLVDPSGLILSNGIIEESVLLPHTGEHRIIVGGVRGNADYNLTVVLE